MSHQVTDAHVSAFDVRPAAFWRRWFVVLVWVSLGLRLPTLGREGEAIVLGLLGVMIGGAWQLAYRRDLVERLGLIAGLWLVLLPFALLPGVVYDVGAVPYDTILGQLVGLVLMESWLRSRPSWKVRPRQ